LQTPEWDEGHRLRGRVPGGLSPKKDDPKHATEEMLYIDPVECIDCGACVPVCPVSAIFALDDLPEKWNAFTERNAKYFGR
jgi:ferredoxin